MSKTTVHNNPKTIVDSSQSMAPTPYRKKKRKSKKPKRRNGVIIASIANDELFGFFEAQERVLRRIAATENIYVTKVYRVVGKVLPDHEIIPFIKAQVEINEIEVVLCQSRFRLSTNICDILDFEIFLEDHGAEILYL